MDMIVEQARGGVPVTILQLRGNLDAASYEAVIERARELHAGGARFLLLDMSDVPFMSSAGLVALHSIALLMRGDSPPDPEAGWQTLHELEQDQTAGVQRFIKLLRPQPKVVQSLEITGMRDFFEIHTDRDTAIASFS